MSFKIVDIIERKAEALKDNKNHIGGALQGLLNAQKIIKGIISQSTEEIVKSKSMEERQNIFAEAFDKIEDVLQAQVTALHRQESAITASYDILNSLKDEILMIDN